MKTIVASHNAELARHFERDLLRRGDLRVVTAKTSAELLDRLRAGAELCFVDRVLPDGDAATFLTLVRAEKQLQHIPVVMVSSVGAPQTGLEAARENGFVEYIELPAPPTLLPALVARLLSLPLRSDTRFAAKVHVYQMSADASAPSTQNYFGTTVDLSETGFLLRAKYNPPVGETLPVRFTLPGESELVAKLKVMRVDPRTMAPSFGVALAVEEMSPADRERLRQYLASVGAHKPFHFHRGTEDTQPMVSFHGVLRGDADLTPLADLSGSVIFRMREFRRISSDGVQRWIDFVRSLSKVKTIGLQECPVSFIHQANLITNLLDRQRVLSLYAPYVCDACGLEEERLLNLESDLDGGRRRMPPSLECSSCGQPMDFDDLPEQYFAFLGKP